MLYCDSDSDRDEIYYLHSMCAFLKEIKDGYNEEEDAVMDDP